MAPVVALSGLLIVAIGVIGVIRPPSVVAPIQSWHPRRRFHLAVGIRLVLGAVFVLAAPDCRFPTVIIVIGILALVAALALLMVGVRRLDSFMQWWFKQRATSLRLWFAGAMLFGAFLVYSGT